MITGANTNVRYRGILFHVQTEDSGRANPHIISHVYHGGTILGSEKTDYSEHLDTHDLVGVVRGLIEQQHKAMVARLNAGGFDDAISQRLGDTAVEAGVPDSKPDTQPEARPRGAAPASGSEPDTAADEPRPSVPPTPIAAARRDERGFGEGIGSAKPLDEVILDYLAEKARSRAPERSGRAAPKSRPGG